VKGFFGLFMLLQSFSCLSYESYSVEWVAENVAKNHNTNSQSMLDNVTLSTSAKSDGKNVIFEYILKIKQNLPISKRNEFANELYKDIVPKACQANKTNAAFDKGLYYTFIYKNTYGEKLAEFIVDKKLCSKK
jgi:hypothetical protein